MPTTTPVAVKTNEVLRVASTDKIDHPSNPFWIRVIGWYFGILSIVTLFEITRTWPSSGDTCSTSVTACTLTVNPPASTLRGGQTLRFYATLGSTGTENVTWSASAGTITAVGDYVAPAIEKDPVMVKVTAKHADTGKTGEATIFVRKDGSLVLSRSVTTLRANEEVDLSASGADTVAWTEVTGADGSFVDKKPAALKYKAPAKIPDSRTVVITAHAPAIGFASMRAFLQSDAQSDGQPLFWLALLFGLLGGIVGSSRSYVAFVGSQKFSGTWGPYYLSRPGFAVALALFVHAAHRGGFLGGGSDNPYVVAFFSGMVGLFSDSVLERMKQALDHLIAFTDTRPDKMPGSNAGVVTTTTMAKFAGKIDQLAIDDDSKLVITGSGFVDKTEVHIGAEKVTSKVLNSARIEADLDPRKHVAENKLQVVLVDPQGGRSESKPLPAM